MKKAFTLAEVLITLGIIGVVAALTIPTLVNNYRKKQFETGLKKEYSVLLQALDMYKQDNETPLKREDCTQARNTFKLALQPYLKILMDCGDNISVKCLKLILNDGSQLYFENSGETNSPNVYVSVDVNGYNKLPNKWGEDLFTFQLMDDGKLLPMGAEGTFYNSEETYCNKTSTSAINGIACANRAIYDSSFWK